MKVALFSAHTYEKPFFLTEKATPHELCFFDVSLSEKTVHQAKGFDAVCCFVTDKLNEVVLTQLKQQGVQLIALRSAGYDHVNLQAAQLLKLPVVRVPSYSPESIAEFTVGMLLALNRKILSAHDNVRRHDFSLDYQVGFNLHHKTVGIIGTGRIGSQVAKLLLAFGCTVLAYDIRPNEDCKAMGVHYVDCESLYQKSDVITLHCPLTEKTRHLINKEVLDKIQTHAILINTGRGALIDTNALIQALKSQRIAAVALDVYEHESALFFKDHSHHPIEDDLFVRLQAFPNVLITGHQAYLTTEALTNIANTTLDNITAFENGQIINSTNL